MNPLDARPLNLLQTLLLAQACSRQLETQGPGGSDAATRFEDAAVAGAVMALEPADRLLCGPRRAPVLLARGVDASRLVGLVPCRRALRDAAGVTVATNDQAAVAMAVAHATLSSASRTPPVVAVVFDEGEVDPQVIESSMRFAAAGRAPVLFICRARPWHLEAGRAASRIGLTRAVVAADDALAAWHQITEWLPAMRADGRPRLLLRSGGMRPARHMAPDYVDADVAGLHPALDPAAVLVDQLLGQGYVGPGELVRLYQEADQQARQACRDASQPRGDDDDHRDPMQDALAVV